MHENCSIFLPLFHTSYCSKVLFFAGRHFFFSRKMKIKNGGIKSYENVMKWCFTGNRDHGDITSVILFLETNYVVCVTLWETGVLRVLYNLYIWKHSKVYYWKMHSNFFLILQKLSCKLQLSQNIHVNKLIALGPQLQSIISLLFPCDYMRVYDFLNIFQTHFMSFWRRRLMFASTPIRWCRVWRYQNSYLSLLRALVCWIRSYIHR